MIDRDHALSVSKQAEVVGIARSTVYDLPRPVSAEDLALMKQIDKLFQATLGGIVPVHKERPVEEPGALLERLQREVGDEANAPAHEPRGRQHQAS